MSLIDDSEALAAAQRRILEAHRLMKVADGLLEKAELLLNRSENQLSSFLDSSGWDLPSAGNVGDAGARIWAGERTSSRMPHPRVRLRVPAECPTCAEEGAVVLAPSTCHDGIALEWWCRQCESAWPVNLPDNARYEPD